MYRLRRTGVRRAAALVPLAVLSTAWTTTLVTAGGVTTVASGPADGAQPATTVPSQAIDRPASVSAPDEIAPGVGALGGTNSAGVKQVVATASTSGIPAVALSAYQRAETVIDAADSSCHLTWQLVAAIGRVESNHGRFGGNVLDDKGIARPGIYGLPLNGRNGTSKISDTDAGAYDHDKVWDRAVGPMQFIPSTWSVVGVDADGDGQRNPQDINDAALATAVYLCSGSDDLSTTAGQESAVYRYNHSQSYVDLVLSIMDAYSSGDYTSVPNSVSAAGYLSPAPTASTGPRGGTRHQHHQQIHSGQQGGGETTEPTPTEPTPTPTPTPGGGSGGTGGSGGGSHGGLGIPGLPTPSLPALPSTGVQPVDHLLTTAQAILQCTLDGYINNLLSSKDPFDQCVYDYTHPATK